jgi:hypothetical protein
MSEDEKEPEDTWFVVVSKDEPLSFPQTLAGLKSYEDAAARKEALETLKLRGGHPQQILRVRGTPLRHKMIKSKSTTFISATRIDDTQRTLPEEQELEESPILSVPVNKLVPSETEKVERLLETLQLAARGQPGWTFVGPHEQYILQMKRYLDSGGELEPITVKKMPGGRYRVTDGHHRLAIALSKGQDSLDAVLEPEDSSTEIDQLESVDPVSLLLEDEGQSAGTNDIEVIREIFAGILGKPQIGEVSKFFTDAQAEEDALQRGLSVYTYDDGSGSLGAIRTDNGYMPIEMSDGQEQEYVRIGPVTMSRRVFALKPGEAIETSGYKGNSDFEPIWAQRDEEGLKFSARDGEPLMALSDDVASELAGMWNADEDRKNVPEVFDDVVPEIVPKQVDERGAEEIYKMKKGIEEMTRRKSQRTLPEEQRLEDSDEEDPEEDEEEEEESTLQGLADMIGEELGGVKIEAGGEDENEGQFDIPGTELSIVVNYVDDTFMVMQGEGGYFDTYFESWDEDVQQKWDEAELYKSESAQDIVNFLRDNGYIRQSDRTLPEEQRLEADDEDEDNPEGAALPKKKNVLKDIREERAHLKKHGKFRYSTMEAEELECGAKRVVKDVKRENAVTKIMESEGDVESASNECGKRRAL